MKRFLSLLILMVLAPAVFAAPNFFTPAANDQSLYMLSTIFGNVGSVLELGGSNPSTLMMYTFYYFNQTVLFLGVIVIVYTLGVSLINTSHSGEILGTKWNSVWIPLRSAMGFALLLPIGSGKTYAVIQAMVMWVIVQGVGAADYLWSNMVDQVVNEHAGITADTASSATAADTVMAAFQYYVCAMEYVQMIDYKKITYQKQSTDFGPAVYYNYTTGGFFTKHTKYINYGQTAPHLFFQVTDSNASQSNTNFWSFGVMNPSSWSMNNICGTITMPASNSPAAQADPALATYYDNQRDILAMALGMTNGSAEPSVPFQANLTNGSYPLYLPNSNGTAQVQGSQPGTGGSYYTGEYAWGLYGGNWRGDDTGGAAWLSGQKAGLLYMLPQVKNGQVTYKEIQLPTIAYLAELLAQDIDANLPTPNPTQEASTKTNGGSTNGGITILPTSNTILYVETELALIAQAYSDATVANYNAYQAAFADENGDTSTTSTGALAAAAKFNGWGSAGAFYLDMAKILQSSTADIAATKDFSYGSLACSTGIGLNGQSGGSGMVCSDARSPADLGGRYREQNASGSTQASTENTALGSAIAQAQSVTMQAQGMMMTVENNVSDNQNTNQNPTPCQQKSIEQGGNGQYVTYTASDGTTYQENCGIVNTTQGGAFGVNNKPQFPEMIMNPLAWYKYVDEMLVYNFALAIQPLAELGQSAALPNPVLTLRKTGIRLLNTSAKLFHVGERYMWYSGLASMFASNWSPLPGAAMSSFTWMASMATAMIAAMMGMGAILAYYIPMVPYLVFTFAFIQWLVLTVEAMTAAPLMALGILHPEGQHDVFGHASMGIATLATVFLRPSLMIVGYFAATVMCTVVVLILNAGFFFAANSMITGDVSTGSLFGCVIIWMMYTNTVIMGVTKSFSLIYHIPDHVTRWIGIQEPATGTEIEQMLSQVKEGVKQGGELGEKGMGAKGEAKAGTAAKGMSS